MTGKKYLHEVSPGIFYLDHRLTPEVRAMLAAMASRAPKGGIRARYKQIVRAVAEGLLDEEDAECSDERLQQAKESVERMGGTWDRKTRVNIRLSLAERRLCEYPLHPKVQEFFNQFVRDYGHSCYDEDTEVLARVGGLGVCWLPWAKAYEWRHLDENHRSPVHVELAAFDPETDSIHFEEPSVWVGKPYTGFMYQVKTERGTVDLLVTPDHRMCVRKREYTGPGRYAWSNWRAELAKNIKGKTNYRYKRGASRFSQARPLPESADPWGLAERDLFGFGQFCGFFIGDGYAGGKQASYLSFHIRKLREVRFLEQLESRLGLRVLHHKKDKHHVSLAGARDWAREHFYDQEGVKQIPDWAVQGPELFVRGLLDGLHNSDGSTLTEDSWQLFSSSSQVMEAAQILGTLWGSPVSIRKTGVRLADNHKQVRTATFSGWRNQEPVVNRNARDDGWVDYDGMVYCAQVSTGFLVVRRNFSTMISGNSILELSGNPAVYTENISWFTAWLLFDSPLCSGQEFSTRAVRHKDWPMAREAVDAPTSTADLNKKIDWMMAQRVKGEVAPNPLLHEIHKGWLTIFEAEVEAWKAEFQKPCHVCGGKGNAECPKCQGSGKSYPGLDKEPFRPALDRARWALPGTISTGCCHTGHLRERARVINDGLNLTMGAPRALQTWRDIQEGYKAAVPGLAGLGLREAVYDDKSRPLPSHLRYNIADACPFEGVKVEILNLPQHILTSATPRPAGTKTYLDPVMNEIRLRLTFQCSLAVARDWHRHRTAYPWRLRIFRRIAADIARSAEEGIEGGLIFDKGLIIHPEYEPLSKKAKEQAPELLLKSYKAYQEFMLKGDMTRAMMCLPLGTLVEMSCEMGFRDAIYMLELRRDAHGANFEYKAQATEAMKQIEKLVPGPYLEKAGLK